jgi:hypothetical protein
LELIYYFLKISRQLAGPAEGVDVAFKARGDQHFKAVYNPDAINRDASCR